jgi:phage/plasmid-like protein (TIGR03299 family)
MIQQEQAQTQVRAPWIFGARDNRHRGVEVDNEGQLLTVEQSIKQGGLDWLVELRDPITNDEDAVEALDWRQVVKIEDVLTDGELLREFRTLGMVQGRYTVLQNRDAFRFFDRATLEGAAVIKAVGHLDHGRVVWAVAQRPETIELYPGDVIYQNMVLVTAHDGSHAAKVMFAPYRPATGTMLGVKSQRRMRTEVRVRHTKSIDERMLDLHNVLAQESGYFERWRAALLGDEGQDNGYKQRIVHEDQVRKVVAGLFPAQKKLDEDGNKIEVVSGKAEKARSLILERIEEQAERAKKSYADAGLEAPNGTTQLDVFLGVSEYIDKDRTVRNEGNNWVVSTFGTGANMRQKAFDLIGNL